MKKFYICHKFGGDYFNAKKITQHIKHLASVNEDAVYISPVLTFGFLYEDVSYDKGMEYCIELLKSCDAMIVFGADSNSTGCLIEKEFCKNNNIKVIEFEDYCNSWSENNEKD